MKSSFLSVLIIFLVAFAFYMWGKKNGTEAVTKEIVHNSTLIKQIAELSALEVNGISTIKVSNKGENEGLWNKFKNYFAESTLYISIPHQAKYGVDINSIKMDINQKDSIVYIQLPSCKLLSLQLQLDKINAIGKTGVFNSITLEQYIGVQKQLYDECNRDLMYNKTNIQMAETNIKNILQKYYSPLQLKVVCSFGSQNTNTPQ